MGDGEEVTISEACRRTGVSRTQIHRKLNSGAIARGPNRGVYLCDVRRLLNPLLRGRSPKPPDARSEASARAVPYLHPTCGADRLREALKVCAHAFVADGRYKQFSDLLFQAVETAGTLHAEHIARPDIAGDMMDSRAAWIMRRVKTQRRLSATKKT